MTRVRLRIAYRGTAYHGWQRQRDAVTVEGTVKSALARLLSIPLETLIFQGASRTDAGVHALAQTAHFEHETDRDEWTFVRGLNALTPDDITILRAEEVDDSFDARRSSGGKLYRYRIWNHRFGHPLLTQDAWHVSHKLDIEAMRDAASRLVGEQDFAGFRASDCQAQTTVRRIRRVEITQDDRDLYIWVEGDAFLKYMVRIISGTLMEVGNGRFAPEHIDVILDKKERALAGITAPPHGLTLMEMFYPSHPWKRGEPEIGGVW